MRVKIFGSGGSEGVPVPFCSCHVCSSGEKRRRAGYVVEGGGLSFWLELSPDFRSQILEYSSFPDYFFISHAHYDHIAGISELRQSLLITPNSDILPKLLLPKHLVRFFRNISSFHSFLGEGFAYDFIHLKNSKRVEVIPLKENFALSLAKNVVVQSVNNIHCDALSTSLFIDIGNKRFLYLADAEKIDDGIYNLLEEKRADVVIAHTPFFSRKKGEHHLGIEDLRKLKARTILLSHISHKVGRTHGDLEALASSYSKRGKRFEVVYDGDEFLF